MAWTAAATTTTRCLRFCVRHKAWRATTSRLFRSTTSRPTSTTTTTLVKSSFWLPSHHHPEASDSSSSSLSSPLIPYHRSWAWQHVLLHQRLQHRRRQRQSQPDSTSTSVDRNVILLLEHDHVYTLGRGADETHLTFLQNDNTNVEQVRHRLSRTHRGPGSARLSVDAATLEQLALEGSNDNDHATMASRLADWAEEQYHPPVLVPKTGVPIYRVERGGEVTYHGPGQLVIYPLLDLSAGQFQQDLHWFVRIMEEVVIQTLAKFGVEGAMRDPINSGVWVNGAKMAAIGLSASRWITTHGVAINVDPDLQYFDTSVILPCGVEGRSVTSLGQWLRERHGALSAEIPSVAQVANVWLETLGEVLPALQMDHLDVSPQRLE